jgi:hypothetical protein
MIRISSAASELIDRHHVVVEVRHDPERAAHYQRDDQDPKARASTLLVLSGREVEEEHEVHADLRNR